MQGWSLRTRDRQGNEQTKSKSGTAERAPNKTQTRTWWRTRGAMVTWMETLERTKTKQDRGLG